MGIVIILLIAVSVLGYGRPLIAAENLYVSADAAILMDARTGQVLYAKNPFKKRPPASTTKVITALLAIESGRLSDLVRVSRKAAGTEGSSIYLSAGEALSLRDLLYGALLKSGNDACVAIAEHIAGSTQRFAVLMNTRALAMGALNTRFVNPHGLPDKNHYTTAYDLALIGRHALANRTFAEIVGTKDKVIDWPGKSWDRKLKNTNKLLWRYSWADGIKTGTTNAAGPCLISSASKDSRQLLAVVLDSDDRWGDSIKMFEYGFNKYEYSQVAVAGADFGTYRVLNGTKEYVSVAFAKDHGILLPAGDQSVLEKKVLMEPYPMAPIKKGRVLGSVSYYVDEYPAGRVDLVAAADIREMGIVGRIIKWVNSKISSNF